MKRLGLMIASYQVKVDERPLKYYGNENKYECNSSIFRGKKFSDLSGPGVSQKTGRYNEVKIFSENFVGL